MTVMTGTRMPGEQPDGKTTREKRSRDLRLVDSRELTRRTSLRTEMRTKRRREPRPAQRLDEVRVSARVETLMNRSRGNHRDGTRA